VVEADVEMRVIASRRSVRVHLGEIWTYRELLSGLVRRELKVRYKSSALGFLWSMAQPIFLLCVYSVVFSILGAGFEGFAIWLLAGLIVWTYVSTTLSKSVDAITVNQALVSKVAFPRAVLPLATLGAALIHLGLQSVALSIALIAMWHGVAWGYVWLLPLGILAITLLLASAALTLSTVNVYARDTRHLLDLAMIALFWANPIIYDYERASRWFDGRGLPSWLPLINPVTPIVTVFQRAIFASDTVGGRRLLPDVSQWWYLRNIGIVFVVGAVLFLAALRLFDRAEGNFAEVL
jgi:ABC-2 type transport system permease protein